MPGIDGIELLRHAKRRSAFTQVLFLTGHSNSDAILQALELGATDYLLKPAKHEELLEIVSQAHNRRRRWCRALSETLRNRVVQEMPS